MRKINDSYYEEDTIMAQLGRAVFDQYVGWVKKYGEPEGSGFEGAVIGTIKDFCFTEDNEEDEDGSK